MTSTNITFQYIRDAAYFRLQLNPWLVDQDFINNGGAIYYAVDTDVVKLYSDPQNMKKYAHVFTQDNEKTREILAWALGQLVFFALTKEKPLLVIPPHHLEIERVINGIASSAARERDEALKLLPQLEDAIQEYRKTKNPDILIKIFKHKPLALINYAFGGEEGFNAELHRITRLLTDVRLLHVDRYVDHRDNKQVSLPVLQDDVKEEDYNTLNELSKLWQKRLEQTKSKSQSKERIADDAEVLARLESINNELQEEQKRLVLISGDSSLHKASNNYSLDSRRTFADIYIRHPMVFLAAPDFLTFISSQQVQYPQKESHENRIIGLGLIKWFDVFLAQYEPNRTGYTKRLHGITIIESKEKQQEVARNYLTDDKRKRSLRGLIADWQEFVKLTGFACGVIGKNNKNILQKIGEKNLDELRQKINKKVEIVWESFLQSAAEVGFWSTNAFERRLEENSERRLPLRGIPAPRFTLEPVSNYIKNLCLTLQHGPIINQKISFKDINKKDASGYSAFFLFSLAFGAAGRWGVSRTLAKHAYDIADRLSPEQQLAPHLEPITGNEAAYLLVWSIRHSVKNVEMLKKAIGYLDQAVKRKAAAVGGDGSDIRYSSEYIAIYMTSHFFRIFGKQTYSYEVPSLAECHNTIIKLLNQLNQNKEEEEYIRRTVKKQLFVYLFSSFLLRKFKEKEAVSEKHKKEALSFLPDFQRLLEGAEPPVKTCFTQPVYLAVCSLFFNNFETQKKCRMKAEFTLKQKEMYIKRCSVMPYDEELYEFLFNLACKSS